MLKRNHSLLLFISLLFLVSCQGSKAFSKQNRELDSIDFVQIKTDSLFNSKQIISLLTLPYKSFDRFSIEFDYSLTDLRKTSSFGKSKHASAAINGGFFNMDKGGSVTYFEINDSLISRTRNPDLKWGVSDSIINGAIVVTNDFKITLQQVHSDAFYEQSKQESMVLVSGPLLLLNSAPTELPDIKFSHKRNPRTCLCLGNESIVFITIDGRQQEAEGMTLAEAQTFLLELGCVDAINLDGGGSTTMWTKEKGVVNFPCDKSGERPVANAILIIKKPLRD